MVKGFEEEVILLNRPRGRILVKEQPAIPQDGFRLGKRVNLFLSAFEFGGGRGRGRRGGKWIDKINRERGRKEERATSRVRKKIGEREGERGRQTIRQTKRQ